MSINRYRITQTPSNTATNTPTNTNSGTPCPVTPTNTNTQTATQTLTPSPTFCANPKAVVLFDGNSGRTSLNAWMLSQGSAFRGLFINTPSVVQSTFQAQMNAYISYTGFGITTYSLIQSAITYNQDPIQIINFNNQWSSDLTWVSFFIPECSHCPGYYENVGENALTYTVNTFWLSRPFYYSGTTIPQGNYQWYTTYVDPSMRNSNYSSEYNLGNLICTGITPTPTITRTQTRTPSLTPTNTATPTITQTNTPSSTIQATPTQTNTETPTNTQTQTNTPSITTTQTQTSTPTSTSPVITPTNTATQTQTPSQTNTPSITATNTETPTPSITASQTQTQTNTETPTNTPTQTNTDTPTSTPTNTSTPTTTPEITPSMTQTNTPTQTNTETPNTSPTSTIFTTPTNTPSTTATITPTNTPTPSITPTISVETCAFLTVRTDGSLDVPITGVEVNSVPVSYLSGTTFTIDPSDPPGYFNTTQTGASETVVVNYGSNIAGQRIELVDCDAVVYCCDLNPGGGTCTFTGVNLGCNCNWEIQAYDGTC